jgi:CubicO group peptidase (beta-lactamase class C family)
MKWLNILLILFFLFCKSYSTKPTEYKTQDYNQALEYLQGWILKTMEDYKVVGLSLVVVDDKQVLWKFQAGYENKEKKIPVRDNTNFNIGSIAKVINAVAILRLVEEKKLNLNDPIHKYVDDLPIDYDYHRPITIKQLLTHHSGLPSDLMKFLWNEDYLELEQITKEIRLR